jgi:hypothetical protein
MKRHPRRLGSGRVSAEQEQRTDLPEDIPEWLGEVRFRVEHEAPLMQALLRRAIAAVLRFATLSEDSVMNATAAPTDLAALVRALSSDELLDDLKQAEPLAPAFIRGIEAKRRLIEEHGGALTAEQVAEIIGISRQAVDKRRRAGKLLAISTGRHGFRYPVWQFDESGMLPGLEDVLSVLATHDEWAQTIFFLGKNPRLGDRSPLEMLKTGKLKQVLDSAQVYGEHGSA